MNILLVFTLNLILLIRVSADTRDDKYNPLLLITDRDALEFLQLPSRKIPQLNDKNIVAACPADTPEDSILDDISEKYDQFEFCVYRKNFDPNQTKDCAQEVKPLLRLEYDELTNQPKSCGTSPKKHKIYKYGFYYCGTPDVLKKLTDKKNQKFPEKYIDSHFFPVYELCIDTSNKKALWTKHNIMTPAIFQNEDVQGLQDQSGDDPAINIDTLATIKQSYFEKLKRKYDAYKPNKKEFKMSAHFMVPLEHVALRFWRKTVNHMINTAPFWMLKDKLMDAINHGIRQLAFKLYSEDKRLAVYTAVRSSENKASIWGDVKKPNIWFKLLHEEETKWAALIVIHNTPEKIPTPETRLCEIPLSCKTMDQWHDDSKKFNQISDADQKYVYCCMPKQTEIQSVFGMYLEVAGGLQLDSYFMDEYQPAAQNAISSRDNSGNSSPISNIGST